MIEQLNVSRKISLCSLFFEENSVGFFPVIMSIGRRKKEKQIKHIKISKSKRNQNKNYP